MRKLSRREPGNTEPGTLSVYILAGVATAPSFMEDFRETLTAFLREETGMDIRSGLLFPYGDWSRALRPQLREIRHDMRLRVTEPACSVGGRKTAEQLQDAREDVMLLIGHSGGGIAALHAAQLLSEGRPGTAFFIVQIGSPKYAVPASLRQNVLYLYAAGQRGRGKDPVCRLGSWGGWERSRWGLPKWNRLMHAPARTVGIPILGGHADYFRTMKHDSSEGLSNLDRMVNVIRSWLLKA